MIQDIECDQTECNPESKTEETNVRKYTVKAI